MVVTIAFETDSSVKEQVSCFPSGSCGIGDPIVIQDMKPDWNVKDAGEEGLM